MGHHRQALNSVRSLNWGIRPRVRPEKTCHDESTAGVPSTADTPADGQPRGTDGAPPPAISCLGAFQTPAAPARRGLVIAGVRKPAHKRKIPARSFSQSHNGCQSCILGGCGLPSSRSRGHCDRGVAHDRRGQERPGRSPGHNTDCCRNRDHCSEYRTIRKTSAFGSRPSTCAGPGPSGAISMVNACLLLSCKSAVAASQLAWLPTT
jgi:hypothetical protein